MQRGSSRAAAAVVAAGAGEEAAVAVAGETGAEGVVATAVAVVVAEAADNASLGCQV